MTSGHAKWTLLAFAVLSVATFANLLSQQQAGSRAAAKRRTELIASKDLGAFGVSALQAPERAASPATGRTGVAEVSSELERAIARELKLKGYDTGGASVSSKRSEIFSAAIMAYEYDHGLPLTGQPTDGLFRALVFGAPARRPGPAEQIQVSPAAEPVVRQARQLLAKLGYYSVKTDGDAEKKMRRAILEFERDNGLAATGRISGPLMAVLTRQASRR